MLPVSFDKIKISTETINPGDWFLPVSREGVCQHDKISEAVNRGAVGFFFEPGKVNSNAFPFVSNQPVPNLRDFLYSLGEKKRDNCSGLFATICGSHGKTTVKEMVASVLRQSDIPFHHSPENKNTKLALVSQLLALNNDMPRAIFEVGARRANDLQAPLKFLRPNVVALLNIGRAHMGEFGSPAALLETKLSALATTSATTLVIPENDARIYSFAHSLRKSIVTFGTAPSAHFSAEIIDRNASIRGDGISISFPCLSSSPGLSQNLAAAAAISRALDISWSSIESGLSKFSGPPGRFEKRFWNKKLIVDDAFNASPESMLAGLTELFEQHRDKRLALVLGSMLELGEESRNIHQELGEALGKLAQSQLSHPLLLFTVGELAEHFGAQSQRNNSRIVWRKASTAEEAERDLRADSTNWDVVYFKGSKSLGLRGLLLD